MKYKLGWQAASHGERRDWVAQFGAEALQGYDDYWRLVEET